MQIQFNDIGYVLSCAEASIAECKGMFDTSRKNTCQDIVNACQVALCKGGVVTLDQHEIQAIPLRIWQEKSKRKAS
jgi:hypothetical protein